MIRYLSTIICCAIAALLPTTTANESPAAAEVDVTITPGQTQQLAISGDEAALSDKVLWLEIKGTHTGELQIAALSGTCPPTIATLWADDGTRLPMQVQNGTNNSQTHYSIATTVLNDKVHSCRAEITFGNLLTAEEEIRVIVEQLSPPWWKSLLNKVTNFNPDDIPLSYIIGSAAGLLLLIFAFFGHRKPYTPKPPPYTLTCDFGTVRITAKELSRDGGYIIGRAVNCDWQIFENTISRQHGRLSLVDGKLHYTDLGGANGTYRSNKELPAHSPVEIQNGDVLELGRVSIKITISQ